MFGSPIIPALSIIRKISWSYYLNNDCFYKAVIHSFFMSECFVFSSESVTEGHPDKICDTVSDAILDACLEQDHLSRVACETFVKDDVLGLAGELTTKAKVDYEDLARETIKNVGYSESLFEDSSYTYQCQFSAENLKFYNFLGEQSPDISQGVDAKTAKDKQGAEQGAGDQGIMFGYASDETKVLMPAPIFYAHQLGQKLTNLRKDKVLPWLMPDGKTQVSMEYIDGVVQKISTVVVSTMHAPEIETGEIRELLRNHLVDKVLPESLLADDVEILINPTGRFVIGGPQGDAGLTGRKIIVDTYGGMGRHGGGAFSGKDPTKVDRSAAYMCRWVAKNIVATGLAKRCELQVAYAIGHPNPVSIHLETFGTAQVEKAKIDRAIKEVFSFKPSDMVDQLNLLRPIYSKSTNYGHFGREDANLPWEETNRIDVLKAVIFN